MHTGFWWENMREKDHLEDLGVDGMVFKWVFRKQNWVVAWINLAQEREMGRAIVNTVINFQVL
jgi:hypothetical protein